MSLFDERVQTYLTNLRNDQMHIDAKKEAYRLFNLEQDAKVLARREARLIEIERATA